MPTEINHRKLLAAAVAVVLAAGFLVLAAAADPAEAAYPGKNGRIAFVAPR